VAAHRGIDLDLDLAGAADVAPWAARDVYRVAQEAVANAVRHASPDHLRIRLFRRGADTVLQISDDGAGFDNAAVAHGGGLVGMAERAAALGAHLDIRAEPGRGTQIELVIPPAQAPNPLAAG